MNRKGFTLIELLAVIVVLALIMGIAIYSISGIVKSSKERVFRENAASLIRGIRQQLQIEYYVEEGDYTFTSDILDNNTSIDSPFGGEYQYAQPGNNFCMDSGDIKIGEHICKKGANQACNNAATESFIHISKSDNNYVYTMFLTDGTYYIDIDSSEASLIDNVATIYDDGSLNMRHNNCTIPLTCPHSPFSREYTGSTISSDIDCPTGSTAGGVQSATDVGVYTQTCTANSGYAFNSECVVNWEITEPFVEFTAPTVVSRTITYTGSLYGLLSSVGSCGTGATMYWYSANPTTSSTAPSFSTSTWTTETPEITSYAGQDAGTYYIWYYCQSSVNEGENYNTVKNVSKDIGKASPTVTLDNTTRTYNGSKQYVCDEAVYDGDGTVSCVYYTNSTCTTKTTTSTGTNTAGGAPANAGTYYVKATASETDNYSSGSSSCAKYTIQKYTATLDVSTDYATVELGSKGNFKATPTTISACAGELISHTSNTSDVTLATSSSGTYGEYATWSTASNGVQKTIYYTGVRVRTDPTKIYVAYNPTDTANCDTEYRELVNIKVVNTAPTKCNAPTNVSVSTSGVVTWTKSSNCNSATHQIKVTGGSWQTATSGVNFKSDITSKTGTRIVYVKALAPNSNYTDSDSGSASVEVHTVSVKKNSGIETVSGGGKFIHGDYTTIRATTASGYGFSGWSGCSNSTSASQPIIVNSDRVCTANAYNIYAGGWGSSSFD